MSNEILLSIVGGFLVLALGINGFFLRGIFKDLGDVKVSLATIGALHDNVVETAKENKLKIASLERELELVRARLHSLEGGQLQVAALLEKGL